jgi:hypothetical protein
MMKAFTVTIKVVREHFATIKLQAASQAEADEAALALYWKGSDLTGSGPLGLPPPWVEHERREHDPEIDTGDRCVDCAENAGNYMLSNELWAASDLGPRDGMLCLPYLARRVGRPMTFDFTAELPTEKIGSGTSRSRTVCLRRSERVC